jgi:hypothetical protein
MADGDKWSMDRIACKYIDDAGKEHRFRALEGYQSQASIGWVASTDASTDPIPRGLKPRRWLMYDANDHSRKRSVVIATNAAYVAGEINTTTLAVQNPVTDLADTFTLYGMEGERRRGKTLE